MRAGQAVPLESSSKQPAMHFRRTVSRALGRIGCQLLT